jgi:hypothetical protein
MIKRLPEVFKFVAQLLINSNNNQNDMHTIQNLILTIK